MPGITRAIHTEESAEVEVLFANMDKLKTLTRKIQGSLSRLETSGRSVQDAIRPVYGNTSRLQVTNTNIERINEAIDKIRQPLDNSRREEAIVRGGLRQVSLQDYTAALDRTKQALGDLNRSNLKSNQQAIRDLGELQRIGAEELEGSFRENLKSQTSKVEPLQYILKDQQFPTISSETSSQLRLINSHLSQSNSQNIRTADHDAATVSIYVGLRSNYITSSLESLSISTVNTTRKRDPNATYQQGSCAIGHYSKALEGMFSAEYDSICPIFSREQWMLIHTQTCQPALKEFTRVLRELHGFIKENMLTDCFLSYEVVDVVRNMSFRIESLNSEFRQSISDALRPIQETAKYSLQRLLEDCRNRVQGTINIPQDGGTIQVTYDTMQRLQAMTAYLEPLGSILASVGDGGWKAPQLPGTAGSSGAPTIRSFDVGVNGKDLFGNYVGDNIDTLLTSLDAKAKTMLRGHAHAIFMINNCTVVERMISASDLHQYVTESTVKRIAEKKQNAVKMYISSWGDLVKYLFDQLRTGAMPLNRPPSGSGTESANFVKTMSNKDKEAAKEKFKQFNTHFDELVQRHKTFKLEREAKSELAEALLKTYGPLYERFWDRYHDLDKGKGKVVKYDKAQVNSILKGLS